MQNVPIFPSCSTSPTLLQKGCALLQQIHTRPEHVLNPTLGSEFSCHHQQVNKISKFDEERTLEPKIEASFTSLDLNLLCIEEDQFTKELHGVTSMRN